MTRGAMIYDPAPPAAEHPLARWEPRARPVGPFRAAAADELGRRAVGALMFVAPGLLLAGGAALLLWQGLRAWRAWRAKAASSSSSSSSSSTAPAGNEIHVREIPSAARVAGLEDLPAPARRRSRARAR